MEVEILYHGTKFKKTADRILLEGFKEYAYFATDLNTAIHQGGKYVFEVLFVKEELPEYWQVRCINKISPNRIIRFCKYSESEIYKNKQLQKNVFNNSLEFGATKEYTFKENKNEDFYKILLSKTIRK